MSEIFRFLENFLIWKLPETKAKPSRREFIPSCKPFRSPRFFQNNRNSQRVFWNSEAVERPQSARGGGGFSLRRSSSLYREQERSQWSNSEMYMAVKDIKEAIEKLSTAAKRRDLTVEGEPAGSLELCRPDVEKIPGRISEIKQPGRCFNYNSPKKLPAMREFSGSEYGSKTTDVSGYESGALSLLSQADTEIEELEMMIAHVEMVLGTLKERLRLKTN